MKRLSFSILFLCVFLPPVLYVFSIKGLETIIQKKWTAALETRLISDPEMLLRGFVKIQDELKENIRDFLSTRHILKWGVTPQIVVRTKTGRTLYPDFSAEAGYSIDRDILQVPSPPDTFQTAQENLKIMEEGLILFLTVEIHNNTWLANTVLLFYILLFSGILYGTYRSRSREAGEISQEALQTVFGALQMAEERSREMAGTEAVLQGEIDKLKAALEETGKKVAETEEVALAEMETLEGKLEESSTLRQKAEQEAARLRQELQEIDSSRKTSSKKQRKKTSTAMKRFRTLYKNLDFHERAIEGFLGLETDLELRAEELIHNLSIDSSRLIVKRKVFARTGTLPVLESEFAYKGRLYWRQREDGKIEVLAIGTKNSQGKDLGYLESL